MDSTEAFRKQPKHPGIRVNVPKRGAPEEPHDYMFTNKRRPDHWDSPQNIKFRSGVSEVVSRYSEFKCDRPLLA